MLSVNCKGRLLLLDEPKVMGIINTTDDSFYSGSRITQIDKVLQKAEGMLQEGAAIIDIGGQSTRPGSHRISAEEELQRVIPAVEALLKTFPFAIISVDTYYSKVAHEAVQAGVSIVNDVSAGIIDEQLWPTVAALNVPYILMHMHGDPQTMQKNPNYQNVVLEVFDFLNFKLAALHQLGIKDVIVDPGFGFGKTIDHNFSLLHQLSYFKNLNKPLLVGLSRKASVYKTLGITAEEALNGTTVLHTISLLNGANILRVHDVKEAVQAIQLVKAFSNSTKQ
ncbi:MAG: dihydropteroate synthase [Flavisolibacter sp.]|nr:dihydropteroate synthase [Flavisolibacter sp.]